MSAPLGFDRSYSSSQMGPEMLNLSLTARRAAMYAACEMTDKEIAGDYSETPAVPTLAERRAAMYATCEMTEEDAPGVEIPACTAGFVETDEIVEAEDMYQGFRNRLKDKDCGYRPQLVIVSDWRNNVGRRCSYTHKGVNAGRDWEIVTPLRDQEFVSYYLIRHLTTGELVIAWDRLLHNLY